tara:strand:+ start:5552 stop:5923 length:372 start_codon:yes stop_codon:yes gene_type:complete
MKYPKSFGLSKLRNHLHFLKTERPTIYDLYKENGEKHASVFREERALQYEKDGYTIKIATDIDKRIKDLEKRVQSLEAEIATEKKAKLHNNPDVYDTKPDVEKIMSDPKIKEANKRYKKRKKE